SSVTDSGRGTNDESANKREDDVTSTIDNARTALSGRYNQIPIDSILFGPGTLGSIGAECERLGLERLLLLASPSLARAGDLEELFGEATGGRVAAFFDRCKPHVPHDVVLDAAETARKAGVDGVVSVGGGSVIDLAKAVTLALAEDVQSRDDLLRYRVL